MTECKLRSLDSDSTQQADIFNDQYSYYSKEACAISTVETNSTTLEESITAVLQSIADPPSSFLVSNLFYKNIELLEAIYNLNLNLTVVLFNIGESDLSFYIKNPELIKNVYIPGTFFKLKEKKNSMTLIKKIGNNIGDPEIIYDEYFNTVHETVGILYRALADVNSLLSTAILASIHSENQRYAEGDVDLLGSNYLTKYPALLHLNYKDEIVTKELVYDYMYPIIAEPWLSPV